MGHSGRGTRPERGEKGMAVFHRGSGAVAAIGLLVLGGCVSSTQYSAVSEALKGSPDLRRESVETCVRDNRSTPEQKEMMRKLMNLSLGSDTVRVGCERVTAALASGRLSYDDYRAIQFGQITPQIIRVLQNR